MLHFVDITYNYPETEADAPSQDNLSMRQLTEYLTKALAEKDWTSMVITIARKEAK